MMNVFRTAPLRRSSRLRKGLAAAAGVVGGYGLVAYVVLPWA